MAVTPSCALLRSAVSAGVSALVPKKRRGVMLSYIYATFNCGSILGVAVTPVLVRQRSLRRARSVVGRQACADAPAFPSCHRRLRTDGRLCSSSLGFLALSWLALRASLCPEPMCVPHHPSIQHRRCPPPSHILGLHCLRQRRLRSCIAVAECAGKRGGAGRD